MLAWRKTSNPLEIGCGAQRTFTPPPSPPKSTTIVTSWSLSHSRFASSARVTGLVTKTSNNPRTTPTRRNMLLLLERIDDAAPARRQHQGPTDAQQRDRDHRLVTRRA